MILSRSFCEYLEWQISGALGNAQEKSLRRYWCDGVLDPEWEDDYLPVHVSKSRQIRARAWIDEGRTKGQNATQQVYQLILHLGPKSFEAYMQGRKLKRFIPTGDNDKWVSIFPAEQIIEVQLL
jgi:hypothetical protein